MHNFLTGIQDVQAIGNLGAPNCHINSSNLWLSPPFLCLQLSHYLSLSSFPISLSQCLLFTHSLPLSRSFFYPSLSAAPLSLFPPLSLFYIYISLCTYIYICRRGLLQGLVFVTSLFGHVESSANLGGWSSFRAKNNFKEKKGCQNLGPQKRAFSRRNAWDCRAESPISLQNPNQERWDCRTERVLFSRKPIYVTKQLCQKQGREDAWQDVVVCATRRYRK